MQTVVFGCALATLVAAGLSAQGTAPKPGPEHANLSRFAGTWRMEGKANPGPMGPGGAFTLTETCRMFEGFHVVCDSEGGGAMGPMKAHMMLTYDPVAKRYRYFAVNNSPLPEMAEGTLSGKTWEFRSEKIDGGKKIWSTFAITETTPTVHTFVWKMSQDGKTWTTVMEGKSTKQ